MSAWVCRPPVASAWDGACAALEAVAWGCRDLPVACAGAGEQAAAPQRGLGARACPARCEEGEGGLIAPAPQLCGPALQVSACLPPTTPRSQPPGRSFVPCCSPASQAQPGEQAAEWGAPPQCTLLSREQLRRRPAARRRPGPLWSISPGVLSSLGSWLSEELGEVEPSRWRILPSHKRVTTAYLEATQRGGLGLDSPGRSGDARGPRVQGAGWGQEPGSLFAHL